EIRAREWVKSDVKPGPTHTCMFTPSYSRVVIVAAGSSEYSARNRIPTLRVLGEYPVIEMRVQPPALFPGTTEERDALVAAIQAACGCTRTLAGTHVCGAHLLLLNEQALKYLIFYRRWRATLWSGDADRY